MDSPQEAFPVASAAPGVAAFPDAVEAAIAAVLHVAPFAGEADQVDAAAYAAVADREDLRDHRDLAYGAVGVARLGPAAAEDRSCAVDRAGAVEAHGDWVVGVHVAEGDPAFAYVHLVLLAAGPEDRAGEEDPVLAPYAAGPAVVQVAVDTGYAATVMERGFAKVVPLDLVLGAEA